MRHSDLPVNRLRDASLRQLRAFSAVVELGTVAAAAERLNVTAPAVSLQLRQLEELVGVPLVERSRQGMRPTDAGREVEDAANRINVALRECGEAIHGMMHGFGGRVSVGAISTSKYFAPRALARFKKTHPSIDMRLVVGGRDEMIEGVQRMDLDFAIMGRPPGHFDVDIERIGEHPHVLIAPPDHRLAKSRKIPLEQLTDEMFLMREEGSGTRMLLMNLFAEQDLKIRSAMEISSNETIKQSVIAGLGVAFISGHTIAAEYADGRLTVLDVEGLPVIRHWYVVKRREKRLLPAAQALWSFLSENCETLLPHY